MRLRWLQICAVVYALWTFAYLVRLNVQLVHWEMTEQVRARAPFWMLSLEPRKVANIRPEGLSAGVRPGDEIVSVNGQPFTGLSQWAGLVGGLAPGDTIAVEVRPAGSQSTRLAAITLETVAPAEGSWSAIDILFLTIRLLQPVIVFGLGWFVVWRRPRQLSAYLLLGFLLGLAELLGDGLNGTRQVAGWGTAWRVPALFHVSFWWSACIAFVFWLALEVPSRLREDAKRPWAKTVLLAPLLAYSVWLAIAKTGAAESLPAWERSIAMVRAWIYPSVYWQYSLVLLAGLLFLLQWKRAATGDARRRMRVLLAGFGVGFVPLTVLEFGKIVTGRPAPVLLTLLSTVALMAFPAALAYVIGVGQANDLKLVVREGLQYLLLRRGVTLLQAAVGLAVFVWLVIGVSGWNEVQRAAGIAAGLLGVAVAGRASRPLGLWVDRIFFREAAAAEQVLRDVAEQVGRARSLDEVARMTVEQVCAALHATGGEFRMGETVVFRQGDRTEAQIEIPMQRGERYLGHLALGPRPAGAPYSESDRRLLEAIAVQAALGIENCQLNEQISREIARREVTQREYQLARDVQLRLLPRALPVAPEALFEGACRPAEEVGGDYYDVIQLPDGAWLLAVADVSGKGISAALIMASLQAALRARASSGVCDVAALAEELNRFLHQTSPRGRFVTAVFARYQPSGAEVDYVCAGHNPPFVSGPNNRVRMLEGRGLGLGLSASARYQRHSFVLCPEETLILYTDGIIEARAADGEEFGEERAMEAATGGSATRLLACAAEFARGAPQHDDMTAVSLSRLA